MNQRCPIAFNDFSRVYEAYKGPFLQEIGEFSNGLPPIFSHRVSGLERELEAHLPIEHAVVVSSGTSAIALALNALDLPNGSSVLCPSFTFVATANAILTAGLRPFFVDVSPDSCNITAATIVAAIGKAREEGIEPSGLVTVDLLGCPVDYARIGSVVRQAGLRWVCDNAQSFGSLVRGASVMSFGDAATTSFYPSKVLGGVADGGCVFTRCTRIADEVARLRNQGQSVGRGIVSTGTNARLGTVASIFLECRLGSVRREIERRREIARYFGGCNRGNALVALDDDWNGYVFAVSVADPERVSAAFAEQGIETRRYYDRPLHMLDAFAQPRRALPNAVRLSRRALAIPLNAFLTDGEVERIGVCLARQTGLAE